MSPPPPPPRAAAPRGRSAAAARGRRASAAPRVGGNGGYLVQVSSQRSEADAETAYRSIQSKYSSVLGGQPHTVRRADLGDKGVYYRAMVGPFASREQAIQLCSSLKPAGGDCVVQPTEASAAFALTLSGAAQANPRRWRHALSSPAFRPTLTADERAFLREARPWGLILFKRNIREQGPSHWTCS